MTESQKHSCVRCGAALPEGAVFCIECGAEEDTQPVFKEEQHRQSENLVECLGCHKLFSETGIVRCYDCGRTFCEECAGPAFWLGLCSDCEEVFETEEDYYDWA